MLLAREDRFLLSADALIGTREGKIEYCRTLPIHDDIGLKLAEETTEIGIKGKRNHGWMMPLALSEWKADRSAGQFDGLKLRQQSLGQALYAPLFVDLCPDRRRKARTWRQTDGCLSARSGRPRQGRGLSSSGGSSELADLSITYDQGEPHFHGDKMSTASSSWAFSSRRRTR